MERNLPTPKTKKRRIQIGRGYGSRRGGHTTGRGGKGQTARTGYKKPRPDFEGGQNPISKRLPKMKNMSGSSVRTRLFKIRKIRNTPVKLSVVAKNVKSGESVDMQKLIELKLIKPLTHKKLSVKVLKDSDIDVKINFKGLKLSETAKQAVISAGGTVE